MSSLKGNFFCSCRCRKKLLFLQKKKRTSFIGSKRNGFRPFPSFIRRFIRLLSAHLQLNLKSLDIEAERQLMTRFIVKELFFFVSEALTEKLEGLLGWRHHI
jgi:hypothetical protein